MYSKVQEVYPSAHNYMIREKIQLVMDLGIRSSLHIKPDKTLNEVPVKVNVKIIL